MQNSDIGTGVNEIVLWSYIKRNTHSLDRQD